jgi:23S rRNA (uracil1939-C5)-methyltransferase
MNSRKRPRPPTGPSVELGIDEIGARGDGVARHPERPIYVPYTVPGDRLVARLDRERGEGRVGSVERWLA